MKCCRNGKCMYNPRWETGVNFCVAPVCPFAKKKEKGEREGKK